MIDRELFARYAKDALANFYDPIHLQTHPLAEALALPSAPGLTTAEALRQVLREALEALRPAPSPNDLSTGRSAGRASSLPQSRPEWLGYRLLWLHYIQSLDPSAICQELGLSQASYYRRHQEALEAAVSVLWEKYRRQEPAPASPAAEAPLSASERARQEAARLARASQRQKVDLAELLQGAAETIRPLAQAQGLHLQLALPPLLPSLYADPSLLRQIILNVLSEAFKLAAGDTLVLAVNVQEHEITWCLRGLRLPDEPAPALECLPGLAISKTLLSEYGGRLWLTPENAPAPTLCFALPHSKPKSILIMDDDPDTAGLYLDYLQAQAYTVRVARNLGELDAQLAQAHPDLILLDVLMPQWDGWAILQRLKTMPETASIPVVVCSVLSQPGLALALGAAQVLQKPIPESELLRTIEALLLDPNSAA